MCLKYIKSIAFPIETLFSPSFSRQQPSHTWSEVEVLKLAAGVEANTVHPIGKAIVEAARAINSQNVKVLSSQVYMMVFFIQ